jgi:hypothetical protein
MQTELKNRFNLLSKFPEGHKQFNQSHNLYQPDEFNICVNGDRP